MPAAPDPDPADFLDIDSALTDGERDIRDAVREFALSIGQSLFWFGRTLRGCVYGSSDPDVNVPALLDLAATGRLDLPALRTATTDLAGIDGAFEDMRRGRGARTVVRLGGGDPAGGSR